MIHQSNENGLQNVACSTGFDRAFGLRPGRELTKENPRANCRHSRGAGVERTGLKMLAALSRVLAVLVGRKRDYQPAQ